MDFPAGIFTLRMQWMHCIALAVPCLPAPGPSPAKRVALAPAAEGDLDVASLLLDRRLLRAKGPHITSFFSGSVVGFLPRGLPGDVLKGLPVAAHEQLYVLFSTAIAGFEERIAVARLLFSSSRDGAASHAFHACCDGQESTLVVIKDTEDNVFGGFAQKAWSSGGGDGDGYISDSMAFLFSAISPHGGVPVLFPSTGVSPSVIHDSEFGPCFGASLLVNSTFSARCFSMINPRDYVNVTGRAAAQAMAGRMLFKPSLVEVFHL